MSCGVVVRVVQDGRECDGPCVRRALGWTDVQCAAPKDSHCFAMGETSAKFSFSRVFAPSCGQAEVYQHSTQPLVDEAFQKGQNALIFAYGQTNSGKTYTMLGRDGEEQGIIPRVIHAVIDRLNGVEVEEGGNAVPVAPVSTSSPISTAPVMRPSKLTMVVSFLEIYNEKVLDLLSKDRRVKCDIQSTAGDDDVFVKGLREVEVHSVDEAFSCLKQGQAARQKAKTALNADSSRSHSVFCIKLLDEDSGRLWSRMSIVDLAGSERTNRTKTESGDERRKEASNINNSLVTLGRCLEALRNNSRRRGGGAKELIPFRDSALTRLFKDSLTGSGRTVMMVNVSQVHADYDETLHALKYASIAREVQLVAKVDSRHDVAALKRAHKAKKDQKLREMEERRREEEEVEEEEEEEEELDEGEEELGGGEAADVRLGEVESLQDETGPVRVHVGGSLVDEREEEIMDALNEMFRLKEHVVHLQAELSVNEQRMREEFTCLMEREAQDSEDLSNRRVHEERERVSALMNKKFDARQKATEQQRQQLLSHIAQLEARLHLSAQQLEEAEQAKRREMEVTGQLQQEVRLLSERGEQREAEVQRVQVELVQANEDLRCVTAELAAIKVAFEGEKATLLQKLNDSASSFSSLQAEVQEEREECARKDKKERKEVEERERQREKEGKAERKEAEKTRKELEKEKSRLMKELEQRTAEAEVDRRQGREDREEEQRRAMEERVKVEAAFAEEKAKWVVEAGEYRRALDKAETDATASRSRFEEEVAAVTSEAEQRVRATTEAKKAEVAECLRRVDRLTQKVDEAIRAKQEAEAARDAAVAAREREELSSREEGERRAEEWKAKVAEVEALRSDKAHLLEALAPWEALHAEHSSRRQHSLPLPHFIQLLTSLLFPTPATADSAPSVASSPSPLSSPPSALPAVAAVSVNTFKAPSILPAGSSPVTAVPPPPPSAGAVAKVGILKKSSAVAKVSQRDSMDRWVEGFDESLVHSTLSHTAGAAPSLTSSSSSLVKRGKERLSSALDALRFNGHRTAPASSLHHALNEPRSISLASASLPTSAQTAKGGAANDGGLLSPKVQKILSRSAAAGKRTSRSRSRRGKENSDAEGGEDGTAGESQPPLPTMAPPTKAKKAVASHPLPPTFHATLPSPLPSPSTSFPPSTLADGGLAKYGRTLPPPPPVPTLPQTGKQTLPTSQPTPVAKRTRQHTQSK